eukprot:TRINITY_DN18166_c0_g1_i1.p1 TRINITY_DN18166_c0_g1~~TRINITY_DN18166_c0_g1_i1.p1  ORF type:complete len:107 (-),score=28.02 TRINITY_DN18166_c0_g1_i1:251-571(-)
MEKNKFSDFLDSIASFFGSGDILPWTDADIIAKLEREAAGEGAGISKESDNRESIMRLSWALVHSRTPSDVQRGIAMLEDGVIGIGIAAAAVGVVGGIVAALARKG